MVGREPARGPVRASAGEPATAEEVPEEETGDEAEEGEARDCKVRKRRREVNHLGSTGRANPRRDVLSPQKPPSEPAILGTLIPRYLVCE